MEACAGEKIYRFYKVSFLVDTNLYTFVSFYGNSPTSLKCRRTIVSYLRIKSLFFYLHDVMKTVGGVKIP